MRVVVAPDSFGDLPATAVAAAMSRGWHRAAGNDDLVVRPLSDGGPGFLAVLAGCLPGARSVRVQVSGPTGAPVGGSVVVADAVAYVESAQAAGLDLLRAAAADVRTATSYGVGELVRRAARLPGVDTIVVGLGGSGTNDGGAGCWAALGAQPGGVLRRGGVALRGIEAVTAPAESLPRLVAATDVDNPLLGLTGASATYGPQKGAGREAVFELDAALADWAEAAEAAVGRPGARDLPGAGAAGGLGFGLLALGAERASGIDLVIDRAGLADAVERADLVVTGEGRYDATSLRGKAVEGVARLAQQAGVPCVVLAGQSAVGGREAAAHGVDEVWTVSDALGSTTAAVAAGVDGVEGVAARIAQAWSTPIGRGRTVGQSTGNNRKDAGRCRS